ncbi:MAG: hypothetical protein RL145_1359, partial [Pseudomonadota bacterium]
QFRMRFGETEGSPKRFQIKNQPKNRHPRRNEVESGELSELADQGPRLADAVRDDNAVNKGLCGTRSGTRLRRPGDNLAGLCRSSHPISACHPQCQRIEMLKNLPLLHPLIGRIVLGWVLQHGAQDHGRIGWHFDADEAGA